MPQPFDYRINPVDIQGAIQSYTAGRQQSMQDEGAARQRQAEERQKMFAQYLPQALQGNKQAQSEAFANATPDETMKLTAALQQADDRQLAAVRQKQDDLARLAIPATTPELWAQATAQAEASGIPNATQIPFEQRASIIAKVQSVSDQINNEYKRRGLDLQEQQLRETGRHNRAGEDAAARATSIRPKMTPGEKTQLWELAQGTSAAQGALSMLKRARVLNENALQGWGAETVGAGLSMVENKKGVDTTEYKNLIEAQTLPQLKAVFGGNPTEGERAILMQIQGSLGYAIPVRRRILKRAQELVEARVKLNESMSEGIRTGEFYQPGFQAPSGELDFTDPTAPAAPPAPAARPTITGPNGEKMALSPDGKSWVPAR